MVEIRRRFRGWAPASHTNRLRRMGTVVALGVLAGCAGTPTPEVAFERGPLPYHTGVFVDTEALGFKTTPPSRETSPGDEPQGEANGGATEDPKKPGRIGCNFDEEGLTEAISSQLTKGSGAVSRTKALPPGGRLAALRAARGLDLLVAVGLETRPEFDVHQISAGWAAVEVVSWLFGGIPSWFVPTVEYLTRARLSVEVVDLHQARLREYFASSPPELPDFDWKEAFSSPDDNVSLWDRSPPLKRPLDYVLTILVPPMILLPGDPERLSAEISSDLLRDVGGQLAEELKRRLLEEETRKPLSIAFLSPDPRGEVGEPTMSLRLALASRGRGRVTALDVHRFSPAGAKHRWVMPVRDVEALAPALEAAAGKVEEYVAFDVPEPIPLEVGENVVKVRVLRSDGEQVTRTMVYSR